MANWLPRGWYSRGIFEEGTPHPHTMLQRTLGLGSPTSRRGRSGSSCVKLCSTTGQLSGTPTSRRTASHTLRLRREPGNNGSVPAMGPAASAHMRCTMDDSRWRGWPAGRETRGSAGAGPARLRAACCALCQGPGLADVSWGRGLLGAWFPRGVSFL